MKTKTLTLNNTKLIVATLAGLMFFMIFLYIVSVNQTVMNVAERQKIQSELASLSARIADLEFESISLKNQITLSSAMQAGFSGFDDPRYVSRKSSVAFVSPQVER